MKRKRNQFAQHTYKGYSIEHNENGYYLVYKIEKTCPLDYAPQYQDTRLKDCKNWIDWEIKE